ncbi:holo-ACP synthase [Fulvivirgaceae bacterium PWU4]|uniref:Holo-[acyl-carrier-protein] synthase n=1 Tax=Chryseosolibacter histidini TaxID=2782349 RepID=A0AAP2DR49_9BACT|nr:holo-ACP synthase [Chryseosolibacter histidini]MBT1699707.1 holo-ACP synthase [Chryseosolibacter histidini]
MIIGTGIDIIEVERVATKVAKENGFTQKVFSASEIAFCDSKPNRAEHYAARFAAKEAFLKATGQGLTLGYELCDIEVTSDAMGKPVIILHGNFKASAAEHGWNKIHLSLSHVQAMACAVVIIEK